MRAKHNPLPPFRWWHAKNGKKGWTLREVNVGVAPPGEPDLRVTDFGAPPNEEKAIIGELGRKAKKATSAICRLSYKDAAIEIWLTFSPSPN